MLLLQSLAIIILLLIFIQDMLSRTVYWVAFPVLFIVLVSIKSMGFAASDVMISSLINLAFLLAQLLLVSIWFSVKQRRLVNITSGLLGWGDILLLLCLACYLSIISFVAFYLGSLLLVLIFWTLRSFIFPAKKERHIPLAGLQALLFMLLLIANWITPGSVLINDDKLLKMIMP